MIWASACSAAALAEDGLPGLQGGGHSCGGSDFVAISRVGGLQAFCGALSLIETNGKAMTCITFVEQRIE